MKDKEFEAHISAAKTTLEESARAGADFAPMIMVIRGGRMVAQVLPEAPQGGVDIAHTARISIAAFGADEIIIVSDTYEAVGETMINPVTGKEWQHGDMADLVENHDGLARGLVTECLIVLLTGRGIPDRMATLPYVRGEGGAISWTTESFQDLTDGQGADRIPTGRFVGLFDDVDPELRVPDPIAALVLGRFHASVGLTFYEDETDPLMIALRDDIESGKVPTQKVPR